MEEIADTNRYPSSHHKAARQKRCRGPLRQSQQRCDGLGAESKHRQVVPTGGLSHQVGLSIRHQLSPFTTQEMYA